MYGDWVCALQKYTQKQKVSKLTPGGKKMEDESGLHHEF